MYTTITTQDIEVAFNRGSVYLPALIFGTKADLLGSKQNYEKLKEKYSPPVVQSEPDSNIYFDIIPFAIKKDFEGKEIIQGAEDLGEQILKKIDYIRVYTKSKKGISNKPLLLPRSSTIGDVALKIHKDLYNTFKFAMGDTKRRYAKENSEPQF